MTDQTPDQPNPGPARGGNGRFIETIESRERDANAAMLRAQRRTFQQIADELGYASKGEAHNAVRRALARAGRDTTEEARALMLDHLDVLIAEFWQIARRRHVVVQQGKVVRENTPDGPLTLTDDGPTMEALREIAKLEAQRAKILGVNAPTRTDVFNFDGMTAAIEQLEREVGEMGGAIPRRETTG